jgi:hypothetical protein
MGNTVSVRHAPFLHLGNIGVVIERVCGGRSAKRIRLDLEAQPESVAALIGNGLGRVPAPKSAAHQIQSDK